MVLSAFCRQGTEAQRWGVTHPKSPHLGELALQVIVPRPSKALEQHPLYVLTTTFRLRLPRHLRSQRCWGPLSRSTALPSPLPPFSPPSVFSRPTTDTPLLLVLVLSPSSFLHIWHPLAAQCLTEFWDNSQKPQQSRAATYQERGACCTVASILCPWIGPGIPLPRPTLWPILQMG